jgi:hypothetical protein
MWIFSEDFEGLIAEGIAINIGAHNIMQLEGARITFGCIGGGAAVGFKTPEQAQAAYDKIKAMLKEEK